MMLVGAGALPFPFRSGWDYEFESAFLQRGVSSEPAAPCPKRTGNALAGISRRRTHKASLSAVRRGQLSRREVATVEERRCGATLRGSSVPMMQNPALHSDTVTRPRPHRPIIKWRSGSAVVEWPRAIARSRSRARTAASSAIPSSTSGRQ
jgi:hypothetical protein